MVLKVITGPAEEALTLAEVKNYLKLDDFDEDDALLSGFIASARLAFEAFTNRVLILSTIKQTWVSGFPAVSAFLPSGGVTLYRSFTNSRYEGEDFLLLRRPANSVTSLTYFDEDEVEQTMSTSDYRVFDYDSDLTGIEAVNDWPSTSDRRGAVSATYTSGWADASSVPDDVKAGMLAHIAKNYNSRNDVNGTMPRRSVALWTPYRIKLF